MNCPKCAAKELVRVFSQTRNEFVLLDPPDRAEVYCLVPGRNGAEDGVLTELARAKHRCVAKRQTETPRLAAAARV